jgi:hypothetical protein
MKSLAEPAFLIHTLSALTSYALTLPARQTKDSCRFWCIGGSARGTRSCGGGECDNTRSQSCFSGQVLNLSPHPYESRLRIRFANSISVNVMAVLNDFNPGIDAQRRLIAR